MAITWTVYKEQATSTRAKSVFVLLSDNGQRRVLEVTGVPIKADAEAYVRERFTNAKVAWDTAYEMSATDRISHDAQTTIKSIPQWATWTEAEALAWHDKAITAPLDKAATLAQAKVAFAALAEENRALIRMIIAMRDIVLQSVE